MYQSFFHRFELIHCSILGEVDWISSVCAKTAAGASRRKAIAPGPCQFFLFNRRSSFVEREPRPVTSGFVSRAGIFSESLADFLVGHEFSAIELGEAGRYLLPNRTS